MSVIEEEWIVIICRKFCEENYIWVCGIGIFPNNSKVQSIVIFVNIVDSGTNYLHSYIVNSQNNIDAG